MNEIGGLTTNNGVAGTYALNNNWTDYTSSNGTSIQTIGYCSPYTTGYYWPWAYPVFTPSDARPIKLKMSEVERLRKASRSDKALKAILEKFTSQIEVTVDFD